MSPAVVPVDVRIAAGAVGVARDRTDAAHSLDQELGRLVVENSQLRQELIERSSQMRAASIDGRELIAVVERLFEIRKWDGYGPKVRALVSRSRTRFEGWA